jgi:hypothetical protein
MLLLPLIIRHFLFIHFLFIIAYHFHFWGVLKIVSTLFDPDGGLIARPDM